MLLQDFQTALAQSKGTPYPKTFVKDVALTALQLLLNQRITIDSDQGWFVCMRRMTDRPAGTFRFNLYSEIGQPGYSSVGTGAAATANARVRNECWFGTGSLPYTVGPPMIWPPNGNIVFDIEDLTNGNQTVHLVFDGFLFYPS